MKLKVSAVALLALAAGRGMPLGFARAQGDLLERSQAKDKGRPAAARQILWFFFSTKADGLPAEVERLGRFLRACAAEAAATAPRRRDHREVELRASLLVEDWDGVTHPASALGETVKALRALVGSDFALALWDEEGLAMARELGIDRAPAYALVSPPDRRGNRKAHVTYGIGADLEELLQCKER